MPIFYLGNAPVWAQIESQQLEDDSTLEEEQLLEDPLNLDSDMFGVVLPPQPRNITTVRALDKITAHITELELPTDEIVTFGTLRIKARTCSTRPPEEVPETFAFLEIDDQQRNDELVRVFTGWMMASSPALNALEHPGYDIWVISCKIISDEASEDSE